MDAINTYLANLQNKVFKLLPMREDRDNGAENYLDKYLESLCLNYNGAFVCYPPFSGSRELVEVQGNLAYLKDHLNIEFPKWRKTVLRSVRLIDNAIKKVGEDAYGKC